MSSPPAALLIHDLVKTYRSGHTALKRIDLRVEQGDFFGLLGPNGAGKSTVIGIICSLVNKSGGKVSVFGIDIDRDFPRARACLGVVPQEINFSVFETPLQVVVNQAGYYGIPRRLALQRAEQYLKQLQLWDRRNRISRELSGGMKRRLMIARALMHDPKLLILDEPTAGVDIEIRHSMWAFLGRINQQGKTIILTTHYLEEAERLCRNIAIIDRGRLVENTSTKRLLQTLQQEIYILDLEHEITALPASGFERFKLQNATTLEVVVSRHHDLNRVFEKLAGAGIAVGSMRTKSNRLEQLFMDLVEQRGAG